MKIKSLFTTALIFIFLCSAAASQFEELDKPPEGAHEGQIFIGGSLSIGIPMGDLITGEKNFVKNNTYTFQESEITKELLINHLAYDFGISFEYMPIDHIGIKCKLKRVMVIQRTLFGSDFQNWSKTLYSSYSFLAGPAFHLTTRKQWDLTLTPVLGYGLAQYKATPVAAELLSDSIYSGERRGRDVSGLTYGAELNLTIYFSGGLFISLGADWNNYSLSFSPAYSLSQSGNTYLNGKNSGSIQTINIALSAGYTLFN